MDKIETLKKNYEFKNVLNKGNYFIEKQIIVYITKNKTSKNCIGIAINTKLCHAIKRNYLKRLIRENYRKQQNSLTGGHNIVFLWNKNTMPSEADFYEIGKNMTQAFKKAGIYKQKED